MGRRSALECMPPIATRARTCSANPKLSECQAPSRQVVAFTQVRVAKVDATGDVYYAGNRTHIHTRTRKHTQIHTQLLNRLLPSLCGDTVKTTSTCGMPDIGKKFKSGQKYTSACKDCATECFEGSLDHTRISRHVCRKRGIDSNLPPMYKAYACVHHQPQLYT